MSRTRQPDLLVSEAQPDLFGAEGATAHRPNSDKVRARRHRILPRQKPPGPWDPSCGSLYRTIFPQMTLFLPEEEGARLRFEFEAEGERFQARRIVARSNGHPPAPADSD